MFHIRADGHNQEIKEDLFNGDSVFLTGRRYLFTCPQTVLNRFWYPLFIHGQRHQRRIVGTGQRYHLVQAFLLCLGRVDQRWASVAALQTALQHSRICTVDAQGYFHLTLNGFNGPFHCLNFVLPRANPSPHIDVNIAGAGSSLLLGQIQESFPVSILDCGFDHGKCTVDFFSNDYHGLLAPGPLFH